MPARSISNEALMHATRNSRSAVMWMGIHTRLQTDERPVPACALWLRGGGVEENLLGNPDLTGNEEEGITAEGTRSLLRFEKA